MFNGEYTQKQIIQIYGEVLNRSENQAEQEITFVLNTYKNYIEFCKEPSIRENLVVPHKINNGTNRNYHSMHRLSFPLVISLVIPYECNCYCKYCFVNANTGTRLSDTITTEKIKDIIKEAADYGTFAFNITGGDPFTRADIFEILDICAKLRLNINISTKVILNKKMIEKLKKIGLKRIQISLDSYLDDETEQLVSKGNYATEMLECINRLVSAGIEVCVNTVVTKVNIKSIPELIKKLDNIGVYKHYITPYLRTLGRHDIDLFPSEKDYDELTEFISTYSGTIIINYKEPCLSEEGVYHELNRCTGGRMGLVIQPSGKVSICERLIDSEECIIGDIKESTIRDIWNGDKLYSLVEPCKELYKNTQCYECKDFISCVLDKGICFARCKIANGYIYSKDPLCPINQSELRFV